jgi:purine-nucleoside phosphorylase
MTLLAAPPIAGKLRAIHRPRRFPFRGIETNMLHLAAQIDEAAAAIRREWQGRPRVGIILGTGIGPLAQQIETEASIDYESVPHFLRPTATGHRGRLVCGTLAGASVVAMEGRFHPYEGYGLAEITLPVRVMKALGAELLIVTNACGGMNPHYAKGDIMVIDDHINLLGSNPLVGINDERLGPRFPDMARPYDPELIERALAIARRENFVAHKGVFVAVLGPNLETRAEYRFLRMIGADVVGMSTVPEVIAAVHCGLRVLGLSIVTDVCFPDALVPVDVHEIIAAANAAEPKLRKIILGILAEFAGAGT